MRDNCGLEILTDQTIELGIRNQGKISFHPSDVPNTLRYHSEYRFEEDQKINIFCIYWYWISNFKTSSTSNSFQCIWRGLNLGGRCYTRVHFFAGRWAYTHVTGAAYKFGRGLGQLIRDSLLYANIILLIIIFLLMY